MYKPQLTSVLSVFHRGTVIVGWPSAAFWLPIG
ncbi:MAG: hypothetical protein R3E89_01055 [Thiolinea sp.]